MNAATSFQPQTPMLLKSRQDIEQEIQQRGEAADLALRVAGRRCCRKTGELPGEDRDCGALINVHAIFGRR